MSDSRVAIVILAAGTSSRLGRPKQLLDLGGEPLLRHTVRTACASNASEVVLVLGSQAEAIQSAIGDLGQRTVFNPEFAEGQSTSMVAGISSLDSNVDGALLMLGDQPTVTTEQINQMIAAFNDSHAVIVQATYQGKPGNPVLFSRALFPELVAVQGDMGAREIVKKRRDQIVPVAFDQQIPPDVDSDDDYEALKLIWNQP